ncbi:DUF3616 domain-containing protein [Ideonella sp.]|uniref:DUF3616 domain-containing protein n=1 Tax=Ideonella sp. TaxID=1929293 RepID=UPI0035AEE754
MLDRTHRIAACVTCSALAWLPLRSPAASALPPPVPVVRPDGPALPVDPPFSFDKKKTRQSASGIACAPSGANRHCLVVFDEGTQAQFAWLGPQRMQPIGPPIDLTGADGEMDAEGAAFSGDMFYVLGSHSVKRESCKPNPASRVLVRFKAAAPNGALAGIESRVTTTRLWDLILKDPYLRLHAQGCLGDGKGGSAEQLQHRPGINIEGLAVSGGRLYAGFRGPSEDGTAPVFSVNAQALFDGTDAAPALHRLALGTRVGIRDMAAASHSLLLLLGPDDHDAGADATWSVAEWQPAGAAGQNPQPRRLAVLDIRKSDLGGACSDAIKPEALSILEESTTRYRIVVLSDGVCDGGPLVFDIPR